MRPLIIIYSVLLALGLWAGMPVPARAQDVAQPPPQAQQDQGMSEADFDALTAAAMSGDAAAQARLGTEYAIGTEIPRNYGYAYFWLTVVKINGNSDYDSMRMDIQRMLTRDTSAAIRARAHSWRPGDPVTITPGAAPVAAAAPSAAASSPAKESLKDSTKSWWQRTKGKLLWWLFPPTY